jgi:hypothetical protein
MVFLYILFGLILFWIDYFFLGVAIPGTYLSSGFLIMTLLILHRKNNIALIIGVIYALSLDLATAITPFGMYLVLHWAVWLVLVKFLSQFSKIRTVTLFLLIVGASALYALVLELITYIGLHWFSSYAVSLKEAIHIGMVIASAILGGIAVVFLEYLLTNSRNLFKHWFFIK